MKKYNRTLHKKMRICAAVLLCCIPFALYAKEEPASDQAKITYEAKINYPVFKAEPVLTAQIGEIVQQELLRFNKDFAAATTFADTQVFSVNIESGTLYEDADYISFLLEVYRFTGGAHGSTTLIPITYSKQTKKLLSLEQVLQPAKKNWLSILSEQARKQLNDQMQKKRLISDSDWIIRGTEPTKENFAVFRLEKDSIRIIFAQYQVAPYSSGMPEITVSRALFK